MHGGKPLLTLLRHFGGMRVIYALPLLLMACNTPSREFRDVVAQRVTVDGSSFDVRLRGTKAEAIRVNVQYAPRFGPIEGRAARAMELVSGCAVRTLTGDQAHAFADLSC
jgi:hypothetical protein